MSEAQKLMSVELIHPVFFAGSSRTQILNGNGIVLEMTRDQRFVVCIPPARDNKPTKQIPMTNVAAIVFLTAEMEAAAVKPAPKPAPVTVPAIKGVTKFVRGEDGVMHETVV